MFNYARERVYLSQAANNEDRDELYFTQTYRLLSRGLTLYHTFDAKRQYNSYSDQALQPLSPGMPGRRQQMPRTTRSICTPAFEAA